MPIYFDIIYDCFCATMAELSSCNRASMMCKAQYYFLSIQKRFVDP